MLFARCAPAQDVTPAPGQPPALSAEEKALYDALMDYRREKGLSDIPLSPSLTYVAQWHVRDLSHARPSNPSSCNLHSWSDEGPWEACCYTSDHARSSCMWNKPRELTGYSGDGYEIAHGYMGDAYAGNDVTAEGSLKGWKSSQLHDQVICNKGIWEKVSWKAVGVGIYRDFAVVWFGRVADDQPFKALKP